MSLQTIKDLAAGTVGGVAQVLTAQPFDTVKARFLFMYLFGAVIVTHCFILLPGSLASASRHLSWHR